MHSLANQHCKNSTTIVKLSAVEILTYMEQFPNWTYAEDKQVIVAKFDFKNFKQTMFFINAVAFICEQECHHPDVTFGFNYCYISLNTHDVDGISINDFICAAKINALLDQN